MLQIRKQTDANLDFELKLKRTITEEKGFFAQTEHIKHIKPQATQPSMYNFI